MKYLFAFVAAALFMPSAGYGSLVVFTDRASWLAAVDGAPTPENFNSITFDDNFGNGGTHGALPSGIVLSSNSSSSSEARFDEAPLTNSGNDAIDGSTYVRAAGLDLSGSEQITFTIPASSAFGVAYNNFDRSGFPANIDTLRVFIDGAVTHIATLGTNTEDDANGTLGFFGIIDDSLSTFSAIKFQTFSGATGGDGVFMSFDNAEFGVAAVPEPTGFALFGLISGLAACIIGIRRTSRASTIS